MRSNRSLRWLGRLVAAAVCVGLFASTPPASATTASLDDTDAVTWTEAGTQRTLRTFLGLTVNDAGAYGSITGAMNVRTYGQTNHQLCVTMTIEMWAQLISPSSLRPEFDHGFNLVDVTVVGDRRNLFKYQRVDCVTNGAVVGAGFPSTNPLRWSSSPWRVYHIRATVFGRNYYTNGAIAYRAVSQAASAV